MASLKRVVFLIVSLAVLQRTLGLVRLGGLGKVRLANNLTQKLVNSVRSDVEAETNRTFDEYEAIAYRLQVVNGSMSYVKVKVGQDDYIHVKIFKPRVAGLMPRLKSVQQNKSKQDRIAYF